MALWQTNMLLVPSSFLLQRGVYVGKVVEAEIWDLETWGGSCPPHSIVARLEERLHRGKSWSDNLSVWGDIDGSCVTILRRGNLCVEVNARFDLRTISPEVAIAILDFARDLECWFVTEDNRVVAAEYLDWAAAIRSSKAYRFLENPSDFLNQLGAE